MQFAKLGLNAFSCRDDETAFFESLRLHKPSAHESGGLQYRSREDRACGAK
jgi:hypothetical protein